MGRGSFLVLYPHPGRGVMPFERASILRYAFIAFFTVLGLTFRGPDSAAGGLALDAIESLSPGALPEVREYIVRKLGCSHWTGPDARSRLNTMEARRALKHLRCSELEEDEVFLRKTYSSHVPSMKALDRTQDPPASAVSGPAVPAQPSTTEAAF